MKKITLIYLMLFAHLVSNAQVYSINSGNISTCSGVIHDTGGAGGVGYSNNENFILTVCSDDPTQQLVLNLLNVILDPTNTAPIGQSSNADFIQVYDGNAVAGTPVYSVQGSNVNGLIIVPSPNNTSGCLTIVFNSNDIGTGSFTITANCEFQCSPPVAVAISNPDTIARICKGDIVNFDASTSSAQTGFNLAMYYWDYDEGADEDSLSGANTSYTFNTEGAYRVKLRVRDDNPDVRCFNTNAVEMVVLVAPDPIFEPITIGGPVCLGESVTIDAFPDQYAQDWTGVPYGNLGGAQYIPDQVGSCFSSTLNFGVFTPGQQMTSISDLLGISMNFEHSYMGDLQISIICPSGQSVMMHNQGGGGTFLGVPIDPGPGPGTGWDYTWSPTATNGTWVANSASNSTLPAGSYESLNPLSGLIGCDLNGVWQIEICDLLGSDDGYIFSWGIDFNPVLLPGVTYFKPEIGLQSDSSYWAPAPNATITADGNSLTVTPTVTGSQSFSYTIIDSHGCTSDTTVAITITPNPVTSAGQNANAVSCANAPFQLNGSVSPNPGSVVYTWSPTSGLSNPNISNPEVNISADITYTLKAYRTGHPLCFTEDQITLTVTAPPPAGSDFQTQYCQTDPAVDMFTLLGVGATPGGTWVDSVGVTTSALFNPMMQNSNIFQYEVVDASGCRDTALVTIDVALPFVLNQSNDTLICENGTAVLGVNPSGGFGAPYVETWNQGLIGNGTHSVNPLVNECYDVFVTDVNGCNSPTETICVTLNPPLQLTNSGNTTICLNTSTLLDAVVSSGGNDGSYNYDWSDGINSIASISQVNVSPTQLTQYCLTMSDNCESTPVTECLDVDLFEQPEAVFSANKVDGCFPIQVTFTNETTPNLIGTVLWSFGNGSISQALGDVVTVYGAPICYDVKLTVTSADGCIDDSLMTSYICPFDYPVSEFTMDPNPTTFFDTNIDFQNLSSSDVSIYNWNFGLEANPPVSGLSDLIVRFPTEKIGVYPVTLVVTNSDGCQDSITHELIVNSVFTLYVPNAFSPNKDGENDTFFAKGESISEDEFSLRIFDRNGSIVFESTDINEAWNGASANGVALPTGVYIWKIQAKDIYSNETKEAVGHITLIR